CALIRSRRAAQCLQTCDRWQHADGLALDEPACVTIGAQIAGVSRRLGGLLRDEEMERERGEDARRHDEQMALVRDQWLERCEERRIKLMGSVEIEQLRLATVHRIQEFVDIEPAAERFDPGGQLSCDRDGTPVELLARYGKHVAFAVASQ